MASCEKIFLVGFSGSGKTTFLKELEFSAPDLNWKFTDLDQLVLRNRGQGEGLLSELIEREGWEKFRLLERQELEEWLKEEGPGVLALGGGALSPFVLELAKRSKKVQICYLQAPFDVCWERLQLEGTEPRPLVRRGAKALESIYQERELIFRQIPWRIENGRGSDLALLAKSFWKRVLEE